MSGYVPVNLRRRIREHFNGRCAYCQSAESLSISIFEIEHIHPRSLGGLTIFDNLCLACPICNRFKSDRISSSNKHIESRLFHPHNDVWADHFKWNDTVTELIALTETGRATIALLRINRPQLIRVRQIWVAVKKHPPT